MDEVELQEKYRSLRTRATKLSDSKIRVEEKLSAAKERVTKAIEASKAAGYPDPRKLGEIKEKKKEELRLALASLEETVSKQEAIMASIEA